MKAADTTVVMHLGGMGDFVLALPAFRSLRLARPAEKLHLLTWSAFRDLLPLAPGFDGAHFLEPAGDPVSAARNLAVLLRLRALKPALALNLYPVYRRSGLVKLRALMALIAPKTAAGRVERSLDAKFLDCVLAEGLEDGGHESERGLRMLQSLDIPPAEPEPLSVAEEDAAACGRVLAEAGIPREAPLMVLHPGGARKRHRWPAERFIACGRILSAKYGLRTVVSGSAEEMRLARSVAEAVPGAASLAGVLPLRLLPALLKRARVLICNDTGVMHLAAALRTPLVGVMGPGIPDRFQPYPPGPDRVLIKAVGAVCVSDRCSGHAGLERLPAEPAIQAAARILEGEKPAGVIPARAALKVLHVHTLPVVSGSGINTLVSMISQREAGYDVSLATAGWGELSERASRAGITVRSLRCMTWGPHPVMDPLAVLELRRLIRREGFDVVHTHNSKAGFIGRLAAASASVPAIVHTVHGFAFHDQEPAWKRALYKTLERMASRWCHRMVFISQPLIDWALREGIASPERMVKIYSGIDMESFARPEAGAASLRAGLGIAPGAFVVGVIAKLWEGKGHADLLEAAALLKDIPELVLLFVGEGPLEPALRRRAEALGLGGAVVFAGFRDDVDRLAHAMDISVLPSRFEGMGRAVLESQAAGCPVIGTAVGGIPDLIEHEVNGLLVPAADPRALAGAIRRLYGDAELRRRLAEAAQSGMGNRYSARFMCERINALYAELLGREAGGGT